MSTFTMNQLTVTEVTATDQDWISFYDKWQGDIEKFFPHFSEDDAMFSEILLISIENELAGAFVYQDKGTELHIDLDYVSPDFRNQGIGQDFFLQMKQTFTKSGFKSMLTLTNNGDHAEYLLSVGFKRSLKHPDLYIMELNTDRIQ